MERIYYFCIEYLMFFYAILVSLRLVEVYKIQQSMPYAWRPPVTIEEFLGPVRQRNEYWLMPVWVALFAVVAPIVACIAAGVILLLLALFVVGCLLRTLWKYIAGSLAYWPSMLGAAIVAALFLYKKTHREMRFLVFRRQEQSCLC